MTSTTATQAITFIRPRTGKEYQRIDGIWHLNGKPIPENGKGNRATQWQIEGEYQAANKTQCQHDLRPSTLEEQRGELAYASIQQSDLWDLYPDNETCDSKSVELAAVIEQAVEQWIDKELEGKI